MNADRQRHGLPRARSGRTRQSSPKSDAPRFDPDAGKAITARETVSRSQPTYSPEPGTGQVSSRMTAIHAPAGDVDRTIRGSRTACGPVRACQFRSAGRATCCLPLAAKTVHSTLQEPSGGGERKQDTGRRTPRREQALTEWQRNARYTSRRGAKNVPRIPGISCYASPTARKRERDIDSLGNNCSTIAGWTGERWTSGSPTPCPRRGPFPVR